MEADGYGPRLPVDGAMYWVTRWIVFYEFTSTTCCTKLALNPPFKEIEVVLEKNSKGGGL